MPLVNQSQLHRLLIIPDPKKATIYDVIGRMEVLVENFEREEEYHSLLPFIKTYYYVTKAAAQKYIKREHYFYSVRDYEILDVYFASLYFQPLYAYLTEKKSTTPWKTYFQYCERPDGVPFLQMILGINTHINADLYWSLIHLDYRNSHDFFLVNDILQEVMPDAMNYMIFKEHDLLSVGALIEQKFMRSEFRTIIERWRSEAWLNARTTKGKNIKQKFDSITEITEHMGRQFVKTFHDYYGVLTLPELVKGMNTPSVFGDQPYKPKKIFGIISL